MTATRIRELTRQLERARRKLAEMEPERYARPQDYTRARTVQQVTLHRCARMLAEARVRMSERTREAPSSRRSA